MSSCVESESVTEYFSFPVFVNSGERFAGNGDVVFSDFILSETDPQKSAKALVGDGVFAVVLDVKLDNVLGGFALVLGFDDGISVLVFNGGTADVSVGKSVAEVNLTIILSIPDGGQPCNHSRSECVIIRFVCFIFTLRA